MSEILDKLKSIVSILRSAIPECSPVSVGGSVRDAVMLNPNDILAGFEQYNKDFDVEIFYASPTDVSNALAKAGVEVTLTGRSFPVFQVSGWNIDISFPRKENKTGAKHTDYDVLVDPWMTFEDASLRRDFTINSMGYEWATGKLLDPWRGKGDIRFKILHPISEKFKEDALRVLRGFKFIARYGFVPTLGCVEMCEEMIPELKLLSRERIMGEWDDFLLNGKGVNVSSAMDFLWQCKAIDLFPELKAIKGIIQGVKHHPEGDVLTHTEHCLAYFMDDVRPTITDPNDVLVVGYAVLTHDFGKPYTAEYGTDPQRVAFHGHEYHPAARRFMERIFDPADQRIDDIIKLVNAHMRPCALHHLKAGKPAIRRLVLAVDGKITNLCRVVACDVSGRPPIVPDFSEIQWLMSEYDKLNIKENSVIEPLIKGRHVMQHLGIAPGPEIGRICREMFESQLDGLFDTTDTGIEFLKTRYSVK